MADPADSLRAVMAVSASVMYAPEPDSPEEIVELDELKVRFSDCNLKHGTGSRGLMLSPGWVRSVFSDLNVSTLTVHLRWLR